MTTKNEKKGNVVGIAATLIAATAAGFYLYGSREGKEKRVKMRAWTLKAKAEVLENFEKMQEVTEEKYETIVDKVTAKYAKLKTVGEEEAQKLNKELKGHWKSITKAVQEPASKKRVAKKKQEDIFE
jgi:uncharacterized protein (UPF0333 family)